MKWWIKLNVLLLDRGRISMAWVAGALLWIAWLASIGLGPGHQDLSKHVIGADYLEYYSAGMAVRLGETDKLYDVAYLNDLEHSIAGPFEGHYLFVTPPLYALLYVPLSLLPYEISFLIWCLFGLFCLWISISLMRSSNTTHHFLWALTWLPIFASISFGQNALLSLLILSATFALWTTGRDLLAGLICSLLIYKQQLLLGIGILWILEWHNDWKALFGLLIGGLAQLGLSFYLLPISTSDYYFRIMFTFLPKLMAADFFPIWHSHTIRTFFHLLIRNNQTVSETMYIACVVLGIFAFIKFWNSNRQCRELLYAGAVCLTIWISPHAMIYDWSLLLLPAILLWEIQPLCRDLWRPLFGIIWIVTLLCGNGYITKLQIKFLPGAVQITIPILFLVYWTLLRHFTGTQLAGQHGLAEESKPICQDRDLGIGNKF